MTVMGTLGLMAPFVFMNLFRSPLPFMATPGHKVYRALCHIRRQEAKQQHQQQHKSTTTAMRQTPPPSLSQTTLSQPTTLFVDLGSGDGEAVYQALQAGYTQAIGIELNWTLYMLSQMRRWFFWTTDERRRSRFLWNDFLNYHVGLADAVMIFGVTPLMKPLSEKLARECKAGTYVLSYRFVLPTAVAAATGNSGGGGGGVEGGEDTSNLVRATLIYKEEEMQIYRIH